MKLILLLLTAVMVGYLSGLMAEVAVEGENSKFYSLVTTGEFNEQWIPFNQNPKINEFVGTFGVLSASMGFLDNAEMSGGLEAYTKASIDFVISTERRTTDDGKYLVNRISACVFESDEFIETTCIACLLKNGTTFIAIGNVTTADYDPILNGSVSIPMMEFDTTDNRFVDFKEDITDVRNVHGVAVQICVPKPPPCPGDDDDDDGGISSDDDDDGGMGGDDDDDGGNRFHNSQSDDDDDGGIGGEDDDDGGSGGADDDDGGFGIDDDDGGIGGNEDDDGGECPDDDDDGGVGGADDDDGGAGADDDDDGGKSSTDDDDDGDIASGDDDDDGDIDDDDDD